MSKDNIAIREELYARYTAKKGHSVSMATYEQAKRAIKAMDLPLDEYQQAIKTLARKMGV